MVLPDQPTLWLMVALLLCLWLLTRATQRRQAVRPSRRKPMTPDELGRVLFEIARAADVEAYRGLFLAGPEARAVLGNDAGAYLDRRTHQALEDSLVEIGARIPDTARFAGMTVDEDHNAHLTVHPASGSEYTILVGTAVRVENIWRLRDTFGQRRESA